MGSSCSRTAALSTTTTSRTATTTNSLLRSTHAHAPSAQGLLLCGARHRVTSALHEVSTGQSQQEEDKHQLQLSVVDGLNEDYDQHHHLSKAEDSMRVADDDTPSSSVIVLPAAVDGSLMVHFQGTESYGSRSGSALLQSETAAITVAKSSALSLQSASSSTGFADDKKESSSSTGAAVSSTSASSRHCLPKWEEKC